MPGHGCDPLLPISVLNTAIASLHRITSSGDRLLLDLEYDNIINNLNLDSIKSDNELTELYEEILSVIQKIQSGKLRADVREKIDRAYSHKKHRSIQEIITGNIPKSFHLDPLEWLGDLAISSALEYFDRKDEMEELRQNDAEQLILKTEERIEYERLQLKMLTSSCSLLKKYQLSDSYRITEEGLISFTAAMSEPDPLNRHGKLEDIEDEFTVYGPYWFHRAVSAYEIGKSDEAEKSFAKFWEVWRPVLSKDPYIVEALKYKINDIVRQGINEDGKGKILKCLSRMKKNIHYRKDWADKIYIGTMYFWLGDKKEAEKCLQSNIRWGYGTEESEILLKYFNGELLPVEAESAITQTVINAAPITGIIPVPEAQTAITYEALEPVSNAHQGDIKNFLSVILAVLLGISCLIFLITTVQVKKETDISTETAEITEVITSHGVEETIEAITSHDITLISDKIKATVKVITLSEDKEQALREAVQTEARLRAETEKHLEERNRDLFELAYKSYEAKDFAKAANLFSKLAENGYAPAQFYMGVIYHAGYGVKSDFSKALQWYQEAAKQGYADAEYNIGILYASGGNLSEAMKWWTQAAEHESTDAQYMLGFHYAAYYDYAESVKWYRKAAENGHAEAQNKMGIRYANGEGVERNETEAVKWFQKAAENGLAVAQYNLGFRYKNGNGVSKNDEEAVKWFRKAAEQEYAPAQYKLGDMYYYGRGVNQDMVKAIEWYRRAARQDFTETNAGRILEVRQGVIEAQNILEELGETW